MGLAAPQVGVEKRLFVYDVGEGPKAIVNPVIVESDGEWAYDEGCLSVPGLSWEIVRPKRVHLVGSTSTATSVSIEADEIEARCFQHELDHLDGVLLLERLDADTRKAALKTIREKGIGASVLADAEVKPGPACRSEPQCAVCADSGRPVPRPAPTHPRRLVFLGTPEFAAAPAARPGRRRLRRRAGRVAARPAPRPGRQARAVAGERAALDLGLATSDRVDDVLDVGADLGVVVAFGRIIKPHVLAALPMVNLHFSLLPRWRGAAPVERAILAGDERTGVDLMVVEEGLDTGGVYDRPGRRSGPTTRLTTCAPASPRPAPTCSSPT